MDLGKPITGFYGGSLRHNICGSFQWFAEDMLVFPMMDSLKESDPNMFDRVDSLQISLDVGSSLRAGTDGPG